MRKFLNILRISKGMDVETVMKGAEYAAGGIAAAVLGYAAIRYMVRPVIDAMFPMAHVLDTIRDAYKTTVKERARVSIELGKAGRTPKDISDILNAGLPMPDIELGNQVRQIVQKSVPCGQSN